MSESEITEIAPTATISAKNSLALILNILFKIFIGIEEIEYDELKLPRQSTVPIALVFRQMT